MFTWAISIDSSASSGTAEPLPVFMRCVQDVLFVAKRALNCDLKSLLPIIDGRPALLRQYRDQLTKKRLHAPHDLDARSAIQSNFVKAKDQKVLPRWENDCYTEFTL